MSEHSFRKPRAGGASLVASGVSSRSCEPADAFANSGDRNSEDYEYRSWRTYNSRFITLPIATHGACNVEIRTRVALKVLSDGNRALQYEAAAAHVARRYYFVRLRLSGKWWLRAKQ